MTYARNTTVSAMRTRNQIEETLERYGADGFAYAAQGNLASVIFAVENRRVRFVLELPDPEEFRYTNHSPPRERSDRAQRETYDQACRQRWRALLLVIKAKLEAVTAGISTIETEYLVNIVLPDNTTAGEWMLPQIDRAYRSGEMLPLLPATPARLPPDPFHERVVFCGQLRLELDVGGVARLAMLESDATRDALPLERRLSAGLLFSYVVQRGDVDEDGVGTSANRLTVHGGSIRDSSGNYASLSHGAVAADPGQRVDAVGG